MPLTHAAIDARYTERRAQELLDEWLKGYFTGSAHSSPQGSVTFPQCEILFNQAELPKPDRRAQIHIVWGALELRSHFHGTNAKLLYGRIPFQIYVRRTIEGDDARADHQCREVAANIAELFRAQTRTELSGKGLMRLKILSGPQPLAFQGMNVRMFSCEVWARCEIAMENLP